MEQVIRFHILKDTRDIDISQLPVDKTFQYSISELVPSLDRAEFVAQGLLPEVNAFLSDKEVRRYVAHMRMLQKIKEVADPEEQLHHVILEDQVNLLPNFMTKHVDLLGNLPLNYDVAHIYVFPQQEWIFNQGHVYETLKKLKGVCAYAVSPKGRKRILEEMKPMKTPMDVQIRHSGLFSFTVVNGFVEHIDPINGIGPYTEF